MRPLVAALCLLSIMMPLVACGGTSKTRAQPLPGRLVPVWSAPAGPGYWGAKALFAANTVRVVVGDPKGNLAIRDLQTGRLQLTITPDPGWEFRKIDIVGDRLYAHLNWIGSSDGTRLRIAAYDLGTARMLWGHDVDAGKEAGLSTVLITSSGIVVRPGSGLEPGPLLGIRLSDGQVIWRIPTINFCSAGETSVASKNAVFVLECSKDRARLLAIAPSNGQTRWQREFNISGIGDAAPLGLYPAQNGSLLARIGHTAYALSSDGRLIRTLTPPQTCPNNCTFYADSTNSVLELGPDSPGLHPEQEVVQGIDLVTGKVRWQRTGELISTVPSTTDAVQSGDTLYANAGMSLYDTSGNLGIEPAFIAVIQAATGHSIVLPIPEAHLGTELAGASGGLLFVTSADSSGPFIAAYRPEAAPWKTAAALGGIDPASWPDACALLARADLDRIATGYVSIPQTALMLSGIKWPKPEGCTFTGSGASDPTVSITVAWIASTSQQANELLTTYLATINAGAESSRIPGGYLVRDGTVAGGVDRALIAAGRAFVEVTVPNHPEIARDLAPMVFARLHAAYG